MMLQLKKCEQDLLGADKIKELQEDFKALAKKYNFSYDGHGLDLVDGFYDMFAYSDEDKNC